jgi:hypothetical protein
MAFCSVLIAQKDTNNMQIYITDTTIKPVRDVVLGSYVEAVKYLEGMSSRAFGGSRKSYMDLLESVGHGEDDSGAINFVRAMQEQFPIGIIREGRKMRCDITSVSVFNKPEYGS